MKVCHAIFLHGHALSSPLSELALHRVNSLMLCDAMVNYPRLGCSDRVHIVSNKVGTLTTVTCDDTLNVLF